MVDPGQAYETYLSTCIEFNETMVPLFSSVNLEKIETPTDLNAAYWRRNMESQVLFLGAVHGILADSEEAQNFMEVGPHSALAGPLRQTCHSMTLKKDPVYIPTLTRNSEDTRSQILDTLGCAHLSGVSVDFAAANGTGNVLVDLPSYPWQHTIRHWHESRMANQWRCQKDPHHEILGARIIESSDLEPSWRNLLFLEDVPWIWDHVLQGNVIFPVAGYIAMVGEAMCQLHPGGLDYSIKNLTLKSPLLLKDKQAVELVTSLRAVRLNDYANSQWYSFTIMAYDGTDWTTHCHGQVRSHFSYPSLARQLDRKLRVVNSDQWYQALKKHGLSYGPSFRGLTNITAHPVALEAHAAVSNRSGGCPSRYTLHPTVIDQCLQLMSVAMTNGLSRHIDRLAIPAAMSDLYIGGETSDMSLAVNLTQHTIGPFAGNATLMGNEKLLLSLREATFFSIQDPEPNGSSIPLTSEIRWMPDPDLTASDLWMPPPISSGQRLEVAEDLGKASCLYALETAELMAQREPSDDAIAKFKSWVIAEALKLRSGENAMFPESAGWISATSKERRQVIKDISAKWKDETMFTSVVACLQTIWENVLGLAEGSKSALDVLMEDEKLEKFYATVGRSFIWDYPLQLLGHANPRLCVLEIGAGTGAMTRWVLSNLKSKEGHCLYSSYVFSDISPGFTVAAQEQFADQRNMQFKVLDITRDPDEQGFEPHSFDLVIASNVGCSSLPNI
jgi:acyl transferase domain-containing protein